MPNHFLLTGNELVADWPTPSAEYFVWSSQNVESWNEKVIAYENRTRYTCTPELLAMLKEGGRYELNKDFETHPCSCDRRMDNHTDCGKPGKNRTPQCFIAVPVEKGGEANPFTKDYGNINDIIARLKALEAENASLKQQLSKH